MHTNSPSTLFKNQERQETVCVYVTSGGFSCISPLHARIRERRTEKGDDKEIEYDVNMLADFYNVVSSSSFLAADKGKGEAVQNHLTMPVHICLSLLLCVVMW